MLKLIMHPVRRAGSLRLQDKVRTEDEAGCLETWLGFAGYYHPSSDLHAGLGRKHVALACRHTRQHHERDAQTRAWCRPRNYPKTGQPAS